MFPKLTELELEESAGVAGVPGTGTLDLARSAAHFRCQPEPRSVHVWGGHYMVQNVGNRGRWLPTTSVEQYAATMASRFGVNSAQLDQVLPSLVDFPTRNLGFIK